MAECRDRTQGWGARREPGAGLAMGITGSECVCQQYRGSHGEAGVGRGPAREACSMHTMLSFLILSPCPEK